MVNIHKFTAVSALTNNAKFLKKETELFKVLQYFIIFSGQAKNRCCLLIYVNIVVNIRISGYIRLQLVFNHAILHKEWKFEIDCLICNLRHDKSINCFF